MTVRVERTFELKTPPERVWEFIADPEKRAGPISVVESFETHATWYLSIPIPGIDRTISIETEDTERAPPFHVEFVGRSQMMKILGEHDLEALDGGTRVRNRFTVEGEIPGVERFFDNNFDDELDNIETAIRKETDEQQSSGTG